MMCDYFIRYVKNGLRRTDEIAIPRREEFELPTLWSTIQNVPEHPGVFLFQLHLLQLFLRLDPFIFRKPDHCFECRELLIPFP